MSETGLYVHVPWCRRRCPYCDFYFVIGKPHKDFIAHIKHEWQIRKSTWHSGISHSFYFGGGTPSLLKKEDIRNLIEFFIDEGALAVDAEITLEANPEDIDENFAYGLFELGINRISLGAQSLDDDILRLLGRKHDSKQVDRAVKLLLANGFKNLSLDLIIGVMDESKMAVKKGLDYVMENQIPHVSTYLLTIEEGTFFQKSIQQKRWAAPNEDMQVDHYILAQEKLTTAGYEQYDISSYAKPGFKSRHNQIYWGQSGYLGLGPGAHSMRFLPNGGVERAHNQPSLHLWQQDNLSRGLVIDDHLDAHHALLESLAFGLRNMSLGINPIKLAKKHEAMLPATWGPLIEKFKEYGWLQSEGEMVRINKAGALFADAIMREILGC